MLQGDKLETRKSSSAYALQSRAPQEYKSNMPSAAARRKTAAALCSSNWLAIHNKRQSAISLKAQTRWMQASFAIITERLVVHGACSPTTAGLQAIAEQGIFSLFTSTTSLAIHAIPLLE